MAKGLLKGKDGDPMAPLPAEHQKLRDADHRIVKGKFVSHEFKGGVLRFPFKKWRGDKVEWYTLKDGDMYEIPLMVARHLNDNCCIPEWEFSQLMNVDGYLEKKIKRMDHRFSFIYSEV